MDHAICALAKTAANPHMRKYKKQSEDEVFTLETVLRRKFGYEDGDFGARGQVAVDSIMATISPPPGKTDRNRGLVVGLRDVFEIGQEIDLRPFAVSDRHARFGVLAINADGITAIAPDGGVGFLPWEMLSFGVSSPGLVEITPFNEEFGTPEGSLDVERAYLERRLVMEKAGVRLTEDRLAAVLDRLHAPSLAKPSSWLI